MVFWLEKQFSSQITVQIRQTDRQTDINGLGVLVFWLEKQFSRQITVQITQTDKQFRCFTWFSGWKNNFPGRLQYKLDKQTNSLGVLHGFLAGKTIFQADYSTD